MTRAGKIVLGILGLGLGGGIVAAVASSSGGGDDVEADPKQDAPLERPGYKVLPNCGGFEIIDEAAAVAYARQLVQEVPAAGWDEAVALELYGPVCGNLPAGEYTALIKVAGGFLYRMLRGVFQGAIDHGYYTEEQANAALVQARENYEKIGAPKETLTPLTVWGE